MRRDAKRREHRSHGLRQQPKRVGALLVLLLTILPAGVLSFQVFMSNRLDDIRQASENTRLAVEARSSVEEAAVAIWAFRATGLEPYERAFQLHLDDAAGRLPKIDHPDAAQLLESLSDYRTAGVEVISLVRSSNEEAATALHESLDGAYDQVVTNLSQFIERQRLEADVANQRGTTWTAVLSLSVSVGILLAAFLVFAIVGAAVRSTARAGEEEAARREAEARSDESQNALELERKARERLEHAERLQREFVGIVSHEFRTPLTSITGFISVLRQRWDVLSDKERAEFLDIVDRQSKRLSRLVEDLLLAGKIQEQRVGVVMERIDVRQLLRETIEEEQPKAPTRKLSASVETGAEYLVSDELRLRQILVNLVDNSIKYSPEDTPIALRCSREGRDILLWCEDQGPGIPKDKADHLLEKFTQGDASETRRVGGVGLGLYIVRNLASAIGGQIQLASRGDGLFLQVRLPQRRKSDQIVAAGGPLFEETEPGDGARELIDQWFSQHLPEGEPAG
jgi:signal transduction histidine kinase